MELTKEQLLAGKDLRLDVEVPDLGGTAKVRPLTQREWAAMAARRLRGMRIEGSPGDMKNARARMDMEATTANNFEVQTMAVQAGLVSPALSMEEVRDLKAGTVELLAREIYRISGISEEEEKKAASFREESRG